LTGGVTYSERARTAPRPIRIRRMRVAVLLVVLGGVAAALGHQLLGSAPSPASSSSSSRAASSIDVRRSEHSGLRRGHHGALGEADGAVPDGTTVFADEVPGVANLGSGLLGALRQAATDAAGDGVEFVVDSGWRSPEYQEQLLREAVSKYGSEQEAARWVATPDTSAHVSGDAVDIGPSAAAAWLSRARRRVRAVPDLRQRAVALRTAPGRHRSWLPVHVRRPYAGSKDAAVTSKRPQRTLEQARSAPRGEARPGRPTRTDTQNRGPTLTVARAPRCSGDPRMSFRRPARRSARRDRRPRPSTP
jgi:D-alanyl-D-alanine carboxypeptidase